MDINVINNNLKILKLMGYDNIKLSSSFNIEETKDGFHTYKYIDENGKSVYMHSKYNIKREVDSVLENIDFNRDALYLVYGLGLGYHIKELKKRISSKSYIFVIEKDMNVISTYIKNEDFKEISGNNILFLFGSEDDILTLFNSKIFAFNTMPLLGNLTYVILPSYNRIYGKWINSMNSKIMDIVKHSFFMLGNDMKDTIIGIENNFENIKELIESPSIEKIKDKYKKVPAIIVSAGPSLDKNVDKLKEAQGKCLIIATDAVLTTLKKRGIVPDGVVSIERGEATYEKFYKDKNIDKRIVFIGPPVVKKELFHELRDNKKLICLKKDEKINEWINNDILNENRLLSMGTSCAHVAFSFVKYIGADPVVFIGQDLAYTSEGVTHSQDVEVRTKKNLKEEKDIVFVKGMNGEELPTNRVFKNFLTWYELQIANDNSGREYINATEGGALIEGAESMKLDDVINKYCKKKIIPLYDIVPEGRFDEKKYKEALERIEELYQYFDDIRKEAEEQIIRLNEIKERDNIKKILKELNKAAKLEQLCISNGVSRTMFQPVIMMSASRIKMLGNELTRDNVKANLIIQKNMAIGILGGCHALQNSVSKIIDRLKSDIQCKKE